MIGVGFASSPPRAGARGHTPRGNSQGCLTSPPGPRGMNVESRREAPPQRVGDRVRLFMDLVLLGRRDAHSNLRRPPRPPPLAPARNAVGAFAPSGTHRVTG